jgi:hypothetical protein
MTVAAYCFNHTDRLASARCLECRHSFCRECITEHKGRLICAVCLRKCQPTAAPRKSWRRILALPAMGIAALCGSWLLFYTTGWWLEDITAPSSAAVRGAQRR